MKVDKNETRLDNSNKQELNISYGIANKVCIGTAQFGMNYGIANEKGQPNYNEIRNLVDYATRSGILYYDTAQSYGTSEAVLGLVFSNLVQKQSIRVITKLHPTFSFNANEDLELVVKTSLHKLGISKLWGLLLHRLPSDQEFNKISGSIESLKSRGFIEQFGVSVYTPTEAIYYVKQDWVDIVQVPFNVLDRRLIDNGFFADAFTLKKNIFIRSVFLQGLLLMDSESIESKGMGWSVQHMDFLWNFVSKKSISIKQFVLQAVFQYCKDAQIILGVDNVDQLKENLFLLGSDKISDDIINEWWQKLPLFPEKFLNPSLWKK